MKHEKKPEFEPWNKKELAIMQLSLGQEQQKRLKSLAEIRKIEQGLHGINKEIETNIGTAELKLKVAKMELADLNFDKDNRITIQRLELRLMELKSDNERTDINIRNFNFQIKEGKPKVIAMPEEPKIAEEDEVKAKESAEKEAVDDTAADSKNDDQENPEKSPKEKEA